MRGERTYEYLRIDTLEKENKELKQQIIDISAMRDFAVKQFGIMAFRNDAQKQQLNAAINELSELKKPLKGKIKVA